MAFFENINFMNIHTRTDSNGAKFEIAKSNYLYTLWVQEIVLLLDFVTCTFQKYSIWLKIGKTYTKLLVTCFLQD